MKNTYIIISKLGLSFFKLMIVFSCGKDDIVIPLYEEDTISETEIDTTDVSGEILYMYDLTSLIEVNSEAYSERENIGFPINGCHEFTVGVSLSIFTVQTDVLVCCVRAICAPYLNKGNAGYGQKSMSNKMEVVNSSEVVFRNYTISIADGKYNLDKKGYIINPKFKVIVN